ncbi:proton myo-inositol cotransporter [Ceratobasidium sp. AG-I]|nr:proton myo-inositol cotransporter [Ceratobasidium sp. AG-I]
MSANTNACVNPLVLIPHDELEEKALEFARTSGLYEDADIIRKGALVAKDPFAFDSLPQLSADEKAELHYEQAHRWDQPKTLYNLVAMCAFAAIIQGMADSTSYIAAEFWPEQFGLSWDKKLDVWIINFTMMAPYLSTAAIGCWLSDPMNRRLGRRRTVFITAALSFLFSFWQAATKSLPHLIVARLILGLGLGISSSTVPMYTAECVPTHIRGALVMTWQAWIAFGSALGYATTLAMYHIIHRLSWRLMLASICVPAFLVMAQIYTCPESPRWLIQKARYPQAFSSLCRLRKSKLAAARDLYYIHALLEIEKVDEEDEPSGRFRIVNLFTIPRNRRAALASFVIMFMQQFCGANIIDFLSYDIFRMAGLDRKQSIAGLCAYWMLTFLSILPAAYTIDTFGRRFLLLATFPGMCISMLAIGIACFFEDIPTAMRFAAAAVYLFAISYSSGEGAVSFTYPAEAFPLDVREIGVGFATATGAIFNFLLGFTIPRMSDTFTLPGAFMWFAGWNVIGWVMTFLFVPETMGRSLEELDEVFSVPTRKHASYQLREASIWFNRRIRGKDVEPQPLLYSYNGPKTYAQLDVEQVLRAASSNQGLF